MGIGFVELGTGQGDEREAEAMSGQMRRNTHRTEERDRAEQMETERNKQDHGRTKE